MERWTLTLQDKGEGRVSITAAPPYNAREQGLADDDKVLVRRAAVAVLGPCVETAMRFDGGLEFSPTGQDHKVHGLDLLATPTTGTPTFVRKPKPTDGGARTFVEAHVVAPPTVGRGAVVGSDLPGYDRPTLDLLDLPDGAPFDDGLPGEQAQTLIDLLGLAGVGCDAFKLHPVIVRTWGPDVVEAARRWAGNQYLMASDNDIADPPPPPWIVSEALEGRGCSFDFMAEGRVEVNLYAVLGDTAWFSIMPDEHGELVEQIRGVLTDTDHDPAYLDWIRAYLHHLETPFGDALGDDLATSAADLAFDADREVR